MLRGILDKLIRNWHIPSQERINRPKVVIDRIPTKKGKGGLKYRSEFNVYIPNLREQELMFQIPSPTYIAYKAKPRKLHNGDCNYWDFVTTKDKYIDEIMTDLIGRYFDNNISGNEKEIAQLVLDFVHQIPYEDRDLLYVKYPIETLCEFSGNCVDLSVLGASMLTNVGIECCILGLSGHALLGIDVPGEGSIVKYKGVSYQVAETTGTFIPSKPVDDRIGETEEDLNTLETIDSKHGRKVILEPYH
jgi:hypothetical protein